MTYLATSSFLTGFSLALVPQLEIKALVFFEYTLLETIKAVNGMMGLTTQPLGSMFWQVGDAGLLHMALW